jgi:hypothetical protein
MQAPGYEILARRLHTALPESAGIMHNNGPQRVSLQESLWTWVGEPPRETDDTAVNTTRAAMTGRPLKENLMGTPAHQNRLIVTGECRASSSHYQRSLLEAITETRKTLNRLLDAQYILKNITLWCLEL